jgi:hypothetical protein
MDLRVYDVAGDVVDAVSGTPGDGGSVAAGSVDIKGDTGGNVLVVTWTSSPCETFTAMSVDLATATIVIVPERCDGDAIPADRVVRLTFSAPVQASLWRGTVGDTPVESIKAP